MLEQQSALRELDQRIVDSFSQRGYHLVDLPMLQPADLFLTRAGDRVIEKLVTLESHKHLLALRPEFTAPALSSYITAHHQQVARWQFSGAIFEQLANTIIQKHSWGVELIGQSDVAADAEIILTALHGLKALFQQPLQLRMGHVGLQTQLLRSFGLDSRTVHFLLERRNALHHPEETKLLHQQLIDLIGDADELTQTVDHQHLSQVFLASVPESTTMGGRNRQEIAERLFSKRFRANEQARIEDILNFLQRWSKISDAAEPAFAQIDELVKLTKLAHVPVLTDFKRLYEQVSSALPEDTSIIIQADSSLNWEYYSGVVFSVHSAEGQKLAGGGRYDELAGLLGSSQPIPAVGFAYYAETLLNMKDNSGS